jgi:hypothetical protein
MRTDIQSVLEAVQQMAPGDLPEVIGELESVKAAAWARLTAPQAAEATPGPDELLGIAEAARRLGRSTDYLYRHARTYPFARRDGRAVRFSARGIERYIAKKM